jgi:uncharacterized membrane protein
MSHQLLFEILRLFHIVAGILWVGGMVMLAFFVGPTAGALGPAGGAMMNHLAKVRKLPAYLASMAGTTVLAGLALMWLNASATGGEWMRTPMGKTFMWGALAAIVAFIWGIAFTARMARSLAARAGALAAAGRPPTPEEQADMKRSFARLGFHTRGVAILLLVAAALMAGARYV